MVVLLFPMKYLNYKILNGKHRTLWLGQKSTYNVKVDKCLVNAIVIKYLM